MCCNICYHKWYNLCWNFVIFKTATYVAAYVITYDAICFPEFFRSNRATSVSTYVVACVTTYTEYNQDWEGITYVVTYGTTYVSENFHKKTKKWFYPKTNYSNIYVNMVDFWQHLTVLSGTFKIYSSVLHKNCHISF